MYERSAIVLERYIEKILEFDKEYNLKKNNENYANLVNKISNYQFLEEKDLKIIQEFDDIVRKIENIQREQQKIYKANKKIEETRAQLFNDLGEDAKVLEAKIKKTENILDKNNERSKKLREDFINNFNDFSQKQKNRNKCDKERRASEEDYIEYVKEMHEEFEKIDIKDMVALKDFINSEKEQVKENILNIMIKNGKNERIPFNQDVLRKAISNRVDIAEKEAECYILAYDRMKRLLAATDNENIKLDKYKKALNDVTVKLAFLNAQKEYIVGFLDYERMTAISGQKAHKKMMLDACNNFELDIMQIKKLYELILKEVSNKVTKDDYDELYNKNYLKKIEEKERKFEKAANNVDVTMGTLINSNYWRIDGIKNIYLVFQKEVSEKYGRDLSEYQIEELEENSKQKEYYYDNSSYEEEQEEDYFDDEYDDENEYDNYYEEDNDDEYYTDNDDNDDEDKYYTDNDDDEYYSEDDEIDDIDDYDYDEEDKEIEDDEENLDEFDNEDIDNIIKNSRKKSRGKHSDNDKNKGLFNKFFKK